MKRGRFFLVLTLLLTVVLSLGMFTGCVGEPEGEGEEKATHTVTFYDGETVLKTVSVVDGEKVAKYTPEKAGQTFIDWYATPSMNRLFPFDDAIKENKSVFSNWKSATFVKDEKAWQIAGESTVGGLLKDSVWGKPSAANKAKFMLARKNDTSNEFSITLDLYPGDKFQIVDIDAELAWTHKRGFGYIKEKSDNIKGSGTGYGETDSLGANIEMLNDGNYTITLTTDVGNSTLDLLVVKRNSDPLVAKTLSIKPSFAGTITGGDALTEDNMGDFELVLNDTTKKYEAKVSLNQNDYFAILPTIGGWGAAIRMADVSSSTADCIDITDVENIRIKKAGEYKVSLELVVTDDKYKIESSSVTLTRLGDFKRTDGDNEIAYSFGEDDAKNYSVFVRSGARIPEAIEKPIQADKVLIGWYFEDGKPVNPNGKFVGTGLTNTVAPLFIGEGDTDPRDIFLNGTINGWNHKTADEYKMTKNGTTFTYELTVLKAEELTLQFYKGTDYTGAQLNMASVDTQNSDESFVGKGNIKFAGAGTYTITYNALTEKVTLLIKTA